jgi:hypothetical protein
MLGRASIAIVNGLARPSTQVLPLTIAARRIFRIFRPRVRRGPLAGSPAGVPGYARSIDT